jgi:glutathione peroxidase
MTTIYDLTFESNSGQTVALEQFRGQPVLIVNTASKCGFAGQYDGLQELHERFGPQGLVVIGFPCDQFADQEYGDDAAIEEYCRVNHGVTFPLSTKIDVNGKDTSPVFTFLKGHSRGLLGSSIKWNFTKFLVAADGVTVKRYSPKTEPAKLVDDIEALLPATAA